MADPQDLALPTAAFAAPDIHYQTVSQRVPPALLELTHGQRQALRSGPPEPMPWLDDARVRLPEVVQAWRDEYPRHQRFAEAVDGFLAGLPAVEAFAEPLLRAALKDNLGLDLDVRRTYLFNAARARLAESRVKEDDPAVRAFQVVKAATSSLLHAALQNFEAFEAEVDGMGDGRRASRVFTSESGQVLEAGGDVDLLPERFAALCRQLDLGGQYQRLIAGLFEPAPTAQESTQAAAMNRQARFKLFEQSTLRLTLHLARLRGWIDEGLYRDLLEVAKNGKASDSLERNTLSLWDVQLNGAVLFFRPTQWVLYLPDEPQQPLRVFDSTQAVQGWLREQLKDPAWRQYFLRFVPARERDQLMQRIQRTLYPKVWNPGGWYEEKYDAEASLRLEKHAFSAPLFNVLLQRKMAVLKDDGLFHAVTTAQEDHKSAMAKVEYALGVAFNVANIAAFVVPGLGEVMLAVNAGLLGYEVYEGFDALSKGEREQAWGYFMDVGENLAMIAVLGAVGQGFSGNLPLAVRGMRPVTLPDGSVRLWKPDLSPFAWKVRLPADLLPEENGLYHHEGRQWLKLEKHYYSVRTLLGEEQGYRLEHSERAGAYEPAVRPNGNGGWLHELDTPEQWQGVELFRRQGHREAEVSVELARRALRISGVSEAQLRQTLMDRRRPPALLTDTLRRLMLSDASQYRALQPRLSAQGRLLARQFDLPAGLVEEIVSAATTQELDEITRTARVPLRLAEEARLYQQQVRIARACEGLYQDLDANPDSARLLLHLLETLPEWPPKLRLTLHEGTPEGRLLASIGPAQEPAVTLLWRGQLPQAFCQDLATAVPDLGFSDGTILREHLQAQPLPPRQRLRQWLGLPTHKPAFRSPMRLADGRLGHPLSGRPDVFITEDALLDKLRLLELEHIYPDDALVALYGKGLDRVAVNARLDGLLGEMLQLRQCMDRWVMSSASERLSTARQRSRERIGQAIWSHWRRSILPELGQPAPRLILWRVQLVDLPAQLPDFFGARVRALQLNDVMQQEGAAAAQLVDEPRLRELAQQFPSLTALDIRSGHWPAELSQAIARTWPRLRSLGLRELATPFGEHDLRALAALPRLRRLDLRGLRLGELSAMALNGLTLDFLGLDWLDLRAWPQWLDNTTLRRIGELSLVGNQLSEIPEDILAHPQARATPLRIALQGNRFSRQALLDLRIAEHFMRRFSFDLGLSTAVEQQLSGRIVERQRMQSALREWLDPATSPKALTPLQMTSRQAIGKALLKCWRDSLVEGSSATLVLEDVALDQLPGFLPPFFSERLRHLSLSRFSANDVQLERFVRQFPDLTELTLADALQAMPVVPGYLGFFTQLRGLSLLRMGLTVDQAAMRLFARLPLLSSLQLDGNQLGPITDLTLFQPRVLAFLGLSRMQIATWPAWLDGLFPTGIERLGLEDNLLSELPALLLNNRRSNVGAVEILLRGNPLSRRTMIQAHTSQHYSRPYTFVMDLPADIAAMERAAHPSDSDSEPASEGSPAVQEPPLSDGDPTSTWQTGSVQRDARNLHTWDCLVERGDAGALLKLVRLLRHSADYRSLAARPELVDRVWTVLNAADHDRELRLLLNGMAEEPLRQVHEHETCPDGIRLEFNQMEFKVYVRQALGQVDEGNRGATLFRLMRSIFRAHTLDQLARREARGRDEAEVRLAYRLSWAVDLQLPLPPRSMLYRGAADVSQGELNQALRSVREAERGQPLLTFAAQCDFWVAYLREVFAARFKALKDGYEAAVLGSIDAHPDEGADQSSARIGALEATFRQDEQGLLERLTRELSLTT